MDVITLEVVPRESGKKHARAVRREGNVPCVLYGHHVEPTIFQVPELDLNPLIYTNQNYLVKIELDGESWECIIKDIDFHPVTDRPMHADFQVLQEGEKVTMTVPVRYAGIPVGQTEGGQTAYIVTELDIRCLPKDIPSHITVDVSELSIGDALHVGELELEGIEILALDRQTLVTVVPPRMLAVEEEEEEVLLEGEPLEGEPLEGEEAPPAEGEEASEE